MPTNIRNKLIIKLLEQHEPERLLTEMLNLDLHSIAERELEKLDIIALIELLD